MSVSETEVIPETGVEGEAEPAEAAPAVEGGTPSPAPEASPWADSPEFHEAVALASRQTAQEAFDQLVAEWQQAQAPAQPAGQPPFPTDPYSDDYASQMQQWLDARDQRLVEAVQAPLRAQAEQQQNAEVEQRLADVFEDVASRGGELLGDNATERVRSRFDALWPEYASRFGGNLRAVEFAAQRAYADEKSYQDAIGKAYAEREENRLKTLAGAPEEPGAGGAAVPGPRAGVRDELSVAMDVLSRQPVR